MISDVVTFANKMTFLGEFIRCEYISVKDLEKCDIYLFKLECDKFLEAEPNDILLIRLNLNRHLSNWYCYDIKLVENRLWFYFSYKNNKTLYVLKECFSDITAFTKALK